MAKDDDVEKINEDSRDHLDEVRKGKPRKFVMVVKGTEILSLVVYKKGNLEKYKKQAKEGGRGDIYYGLIEGRGPDITFKLSEAEGFKKAPVKSIVLKTFLEENAEYKAKPLIEIVPSLGPMLDPDDPLVQQFTALQAEALAACDAHPDQAERINALCLEIGAHFDNEQVEDAKTKLADLKNLLGSLAGTSKQPPTDEPSKTDAPSQSLGDEKAFRDLFGKLAPELTVLQKSGAQSAVALSGDLKKASILAEGGNFAAAANTCQGIAESLLKEWTDRLKEVSARVEKLLAGDFTERTGDVEKIKSVFGFAKERAADERFGSALVALTNLEKLLVAAEASDAPKESDVIQEGTVAARAKFVTSRWQSSLRQVRLEIDKLRDAIALEDTEEEDPNELPDQIEEFVEEFVGDFNDTILGFQKAGDDGAVAGAVKAIREFRQRIPSEPLIQHLGEAEAEMGVRVDVEKALTEALDEMEANLV